MMNIVQQDFINYFSFPGLKMRSLQDDDIEVLVPIINAAYSYQDEAKGQPRTNPEHLRKRAVEVEFYVLIDEDRIVGCVYLEPKGSKLHFGLLTLIDELRGKGIGTAIMDAIDKYAADNDFEAVALDYMSLAPWLKNYYEKHGFVATGEVTPWGTIDLIKMKKNL
jgi:GNAT superfamily N-acetyltransferase